MTPPSTCISANRLPSLSTSMKVGANIPGIEAEAIKTDGTGRSRAGCARHVSVHGALGIEIGRYDKQKTALALLERDGVEQSSLA